MMCAGAICCPRGHLVKTQQRRTCWCFTCRRRTRWTWTVWVSDEVEDWYGPGGEWRCENESPGNRHSDLFPGREYLDLEE
jgi:hypothetical protein